ncbi:3-isopropylmalate dehydratase small subunit [Alsobacter sp. SYSU BS001988]
MRNPVATVTGPMAPMLTPNVNTDQIIPSAWLRTATAELGEGLFGAQRYDEAGRERPGFLLNRPEFRNARILLAGENFGCGSSREAAVWALVQFGIGCVLAPSFADIFYENAFRNGLVAGIVDAATFRALEQASPGGAGAFRVDLASATVTAPSGESFGFTIPASRAHALMRGDDEIAITLAFESEIEAHYDRSLASSRWLFPDHLVERQAS